MPETYFDFSEFACKCGCGKNEAKQELIDKLNVARSHAGTPFHISSGTRCEVNNRIGGGSLDSAHLAGWAADIQCNSSRPRHKILTGLREAGFTRIGLGITFIHADCDPDKPTDVTWIYT